MKKELRTRKRKVWKRYWALKGIFKKMGLESKIKM